MFWPPLCRLCVDYQRDSAHHHLKFLLPNFCITIATNIAPIASDIASIATINMLLLLNIAAHSEFTVTDLPVLVPVNRPNHVVNFPKRHLDQSGSPTDYYQK